MRDLKFRVWSKKHNRYLKLSGLHYEGDKLDGVFVIESIIGGIPNTIFLEPEDVIIEQYTGLKDKNGKEIYEGDILRLTRKVARDKSTLYQVIWDEYIVAFNTKNLDKKRWDIGYLNEPEVKKNYKVIGNIHENPELLRGD